MIRIAKQDRQGVRTATDLEQKYGFGRSFTELYGLIEQTQINYEEAISQLDKELDHEEIFNRLTDGGKVQTIYRENGNIYINASYIRSGILAANLVDAENLKVKAANVQGVLTAEQINTQGLAVNAADIIGMLNANQIDSKFLQVYAANIIGVLTADQIAVDTIQIKGANICGTLDADTVTIINLDADNIKSGTLSGSRIAANAIGTLQLAADVEIYSPTIIAGLFRAMDNDSYAEFTANDFTLYDEDGSEKVVFELYRDIGDGEANAARIKLGNTSRAYMQKYYSSNGENMFWLGNGCFTCGFLFNFDTREYKIYGEQNQQMDEGALPEQEA